MSREQKFAWFYLACFAYLIFAFELLVYYRF